MSKPKFILTRFTHGSAGKFLSSVLQTSDRIDHWSDVIQSNKTEKKFLNQLILQYVSRSFPIDHSVYLRSEPMVPYNTDLYSTGLPRGNDVNLDQYLNYSRDKQDSRLLQAIDNNLTVNLVFNKPEVPKFCQNSDVVTITVTTTREQEWLFKTLWSKHFLEIDNTIRYLPSDPCYCNFRSLVPVLTFKNPYVFTKKDKEYLYKKYVINNHTNPWYFDIRHFEEFDKAYNLNNYFVSLDSILSHDKFLKTVEQLFDKFNLGNPDLVLIKEMHEIWLLRQFDYEHYE